LAIKRTSDSGGWSGGPDDPYGLKEFAVDYSRLTHLAPTGAMVSLLSEAHDVLANPVAVAPSTGRSWAAVRSMTAIVTKQCHLEVSDVFKVSAE
jgi:hypothetical protein